MQTAAFYSSLLISRSRSNCTLLSKKSKACFNLTNYSKIGEKCQFNTSKWFFNFTFWLLKLYCGLDFHNNSHILGFIECQAEAMKPEARLLHEDLLSSWMRGNFSRWRKKDAMLNLERGAFLVLSQTWQGPGQRPGFPLVAHIFFPCRIPFLSEII